MAVLLQSRRGRAVVAEAVESLADVENQVSKKGVRQCI